MVSQSWITIGSFNNFMVHIVSNGIVMYWFNFFDLYYIVFM